MGKTFEFNAPFSCPQKTFQTQLKKKVQYCFYQQKYIWTNRKSYAINLAMTKADLYNIATGKAIGIQ